MITINLLPIELRPIKRTPVPYILSAVIIVMAAAVCGNMFIANSLEISNLDSTLDQNEKVLASLKESVDKYNRLSEEKKLLAAQLNTIDEIASDRNIWSRHLYKLSELSLSNMWYSKIMVKTRVTSVEKEEYDPKSKKTKTVKSKETQSVLNLEGFVSPDSSGQLSIHPFTSSAEADEEFSEKFLLDQWNMTDTFFEDVAVKEFSLEYIILRGGTQ